MDAWMALGRAHCACYCRVFAILHPACMWDDITAGSFLPFYDNDDDVLTDRRGEEAGQGRAKKVRIRDGISGRVEVR